MDLDELEDVEFHAENLDYHATIAYKTVSTPDESLAVFEITIDRKFQRAFVETIFPTSLLVLLGTVSTSSVQKW